MESAVITDEPAELSFEREETARHSQRTGINILIAAGLVLLVFLAFYPAVRNQMLTWDDERNIVQNPFLHPPSWSGLVHIWKHPIERNYIPLFYTSLLPDIIFFKGEPWAYHGGNVLIHAASTALVFLLLSQLLRGKRGRLLAATCGALIFGVHPIQAEAVSWATGRKDLLGGLFCIASMILYVGRRGERDYWRYAGALVMFAAALLCKANAVALPVALFALDWFTERRPLKRSLLLLLPWFAISIAWAFVASKAQPHPERLLRITPGGGGRLLVAADALIFYMRQIFWPFNFSPDYGRTPVRALESPLRFFSIPLVGVAAVLLFRRRGPVAAAGALFGAFLIPVLGLAPFDNQINSTVTDRYAYAAMVGVALLIAGLIAVLCEGNRNVRLAAVTLVLLAAVFLVIASNRQSRVWHDNESLWTHAVKAAPNSSVAHTNLGMVYGTAGKANPAEKEFRRAIELDSNNANAMNNLGILLQQTGRNDEALTELKKAVEVDPQQLLAHTALAGIYFSKQMGDDAIRHAQEALKIQPGFPLAATHLASTYAALGRLDEATSVTGEALRLNPTDELLLSVKTDLEKLKAASTPQ